MIVIGMLEGLRSSDIGMLEIEITKGGNYWYDKDKDLTLGVGGCGRKQSLMVDVVTELRCRYLKLALVSTGSKVFETDEEDSKQADLQTGSEKIFVVY